MKYKLTLVAGLLFIAIVVFLFVQRNAYYTNSANEYIKEDTFGFTCKVVKKPNGKGQILRFDFDFYDQRNVAAQDLTVIPVVNQKDTLPLAYVGVGVYSYNYPEKVERLDLTVKYKMDSAGQESLQKKSYYDLGKNYTYRFKF